MGNGPSLNKTNLDLLKDDYSFALNQINLIYSKYEWRPSVFSSFSVRFSDDRRWFKNIKESIDLDIPLFLTVNMKDRIDKDKGVYYLKNVGLTDCDHTDDSQWSYDITDKVTSYGTTLMGVVEIAVYMGFDDIYLLGCDLGYGKTKMNHFVPNYLGGLSGMYNHYIENTHKLMKKMVEKVNKNIYNATVGGELEVYERVDFEDIIKK